MPDKPTDKAGRHLNKLFDSPTFESPYHISIDVKHAGRHLNKLFDLPSTEETENMFDYNLNVIDATQRVMVTFDIPQTDNAYDTEAALRLMSKAACDVRERHAGYTIRFGGNMKNELTGITATLAPGTDCDGLRWADFDEYSIAQALR